jgi:ribose transport system permease protein
MLSKHWWGGVLHKYGLVLLLFAVCIGFSLDPATPAFATMRNFKFVLSSETLTAVVALGMVFTLVVGEFDLSLGNIMSLASCISAGLMFHDHAPLWVAILASMGVGVGIGTINGLIVTRLKVNSIVTTLGMLIIVTAMESWYTAGNSITQGISPGLLSMGYGQIVGIPDPVIALIVLAAILWYVLEQTPMGRKLHAVGANSAAASVLGLPVRRLTLISFVMGGLVVGFGGVLLIAIQGSAVPGVGQSYLFAALAGAMLGATTIRPGRFNVLGTLTAVSFLAFTVNGLTLSGGPSWVNSAFDGAALIVAVGISVWSGSGPEGSVIMKDRGSESNEMILGAESSVVSAEEEGLGSTS